MSENTSAVEGNCATHESMSVCSATVAPTITPTEEPRSVTVSATPSFFTEEPKQTSHPHEDHDDFEHNPPMPMFNFIIDNKTLEVVEDKTGSV